MDKARQTSPVRRFGLRIDTPEDEPNFPMVTILVDGEEVLATAKGHRYAGLDPAEILGPASPLLPARRARRVSIYGCGCGLSGCGYVSARIVERNGLVTWSDLKYRASAGPKSAPATDAESAGQPDAGPGLGIGDLVFDAEQYRGEVQRACADLSWETPARATARLLNQKLDAQHEHFTKLGWDRWQVVPRARRANMFRVFFAGAGTDIEVALTAGPGSPEERAFEMAAFLRASLPEPQPEADLEANGGG